MTTAKIKLHSIEDLLRKNGFKKVRGRNHWNNPSEKYVINIIEKGFEYNVCQIPYSDIVKVPTKGDVLSVDITTIRLIAGDFLGGTMVSYSEAYWKLFEWLSKNLVDFKYPIVKRIKLQ